MTYTRPAAFEITERRFLCYHGYRNFDIWIYTSKSRLWIVVKRNDGTLCADLYQTRPANAISLLRWTMNQIRQERWGKSIGQEIAS